MTDETVQERLIKALWVRLTRARKRNDILQGMVTWQARRIELLESMTTDKAIAERMFK